MKTIKVIFMIFFSAILFYSCGTEEEIKEEIIRPVKVMEVATVFDYQLKDFPGVTQETQESQISFRVGGPIVKFPVEEGQKVKKGQLLAQIDSRDFEIDLMAKTAKYEQTKATKERFEVLYKKDAVSKNELDLRVANYFNAKSSFENAKNALNDTKLRAKFSGFVDQKFGEVFDQVNAQQPILTMVDISVIEIKYYIPENIAVQFKNFSKATIKFEVYPDVEFGATLKEIGKKAESAGFPVTLYLNHENLKNTEYIFGPGMSCVVNMTLQEKVIKDKSNAVYVPYQAILSTGAETLPTVWVVDKSSMTVSKRSIKTGQMFIRDYIQVVEGLSTGEIVVTAGVGQLLEKQKIKFIEERL